MVNLDTHAHTHTHCLSHTHTHTHTHTQFIGANLRIFLPNIGRSFTVRNGRVHGLRVILRAVYYADLKRERNKNCLSLLENMQGSHLCIVCIGDGVFARGHENK